MCRRRDELLFTNGGLLGFDFVPSSKRLAPWKGQLPPQAVPWQVHGKMDGFLFDRDRIAQDHPKHDSVLLDYRKDIIDKNQVRPCPPCPTPKLAQQTSNTAADWCGLRRRLASRSTAPPPAAHVMSAAARRTHAL